VKAAWHQVTEALARGDGRTACADMTADVQRGFAAYGSSCEDAARTEVAQFMNPGDVQSVASVTFTGVTVRGDRATVNCYLTSGLRDLAAL
jgi:hypothetical protein